MKRFFSKVAPDPSGCHLWTGHLAPTGYGQIKLGGRKGQPVGAHRVAWELAHGPIPEGRHVLHVCDRRACVNPDHLFLGTNADNVADKVAKGRQPRGERIHAAKLTREDVLGIRRELSKGRPTSGVAADFGVSPRTIRDIRAGATWSWVD